MSDAEQQPRPVRRLVERAVNAVADNAGQYQVIVDTLKVVRDKADILDLEIDGLKTAQLAYEQTIRDLRTELNAYRTAYQRTLPPGTTRSRRKKETA